MAVVDVAPQSAATAGISGVQRGDLMFAGLVRLCAFLAVCLILALVLVLFVNSRETITRYGFNFLTSTNWRPNEVAGQLPEFGAASFIYGTIVTSFIALMLAVPFALAAAIYVSEYAPRWLGGPVAFAVELLVTIPSVAYGLWGIFMLAPFMRDTVQPFLQATLGKLPLIGEFFQGTPTGKDMMTGGVILAIMVLPTILSISRDVIALVPRLQKEGMLAMGATKWETIRLTILPFARTGILAAAMLGLARAIGETMAVTMLIGNASGRINPSLYLPSATIASAIANQFGDATGALHFSAVVELGLVLLVLASIFNIGARFLVRRVSQLPGGGRA